VTRLKLHAVVLAALAMTASAATLAAERDPFDSPQWPNLALDGPEWPNVRPEDLPDPRPNPQPAFLDPEQVANRILGQTEGATSGSALGEITGSTARLPERPPERRLSPYAFEVGARYWYSEGMIRFGFANGNPQFGSPTSTLNWSGMSAHSGEIFGRVDHKPTGWFVKGLFGLGAVADGQIADRDFLAQQISFSDTTSNIKDGSLIYGMIDFGWAYSPVSDIRIGFFVGYHYWSESVTAFGVLCNPVSFPVNFCGAPDSVAIPFDTAVLRYEPTWHVVRLGFEGRAAIAERWSVSGEIAAVPFAVVQNKDSHLLRQDPADLGPAPNVITDSKYAFGVETEVFINYALTPNIEIGGGARYWGLASYDGRVSHGPGFASGDPLTNFEMQRIGVLLQVKGKF
jgi:hypothetical protein